MEIFHRRHQMRFSREELRQRKREFSWLLSQMGRRRGKILTVGLLGLLSAAMGLAAGVAAKYLIDAVTGHGAGQLYRAAGGMALTMLGSAALQAVSSRVSARVHIQVKNEIQYDAYRHVLRAGWEALEPYRSGDLMSRLTSDVNTVSDGIIGLLPGLAASLAKLLGAFGILAHYDPAMALIALLGVPVTLGLSRMLLRKMRGYNLKMKELAGDILSFQEDSLRNLTGIKAFSAADLFAQKLRRLQDTYAGAFLSCTDFQIGMTSFLSLVSMAVTGVCFGWGVYRLWCGSITYGSLTLFLQLAAVLRGAFSALVSLAQQAVSVTASVGRILAVEALPGEDTQVPRGFARESAPVIRIEQASFRYRSGDTVLSPFDFTARRGDLVAIVGPSGEGKTTLLRLLLGLVQPSTGQAVLVGRGGQRYPITAGTRGAFAYVPQDSSIFAGTIAENLRLARPDASDAELEQVLKIACAWDFVSRFPEGLRHLLGPGGRGISAGQAQRLAIARALLRRAPILLLDEATSGLDMATERRLLENLRRCDLLQACILVTHRPESARFCSRIYEIRNRQVTELTHGAENHDSSPAGIDGAAAGAAG